MYDDIVQVVNDYLSSPNFDPYAKLKSRKSFIRSMESSYVLSPLRPQKKDVRLHDGGSVSVPVFDAKAMILDLLTNPSLMKTKNFAKGYDVLTGNVDDNVMSNNNYGEIHTGDEWLPARNRFCCPLDDFHNHMPVGLVIFGDKSHTDLHGSLALTPIIFTLTMFNQTSRNNPKFWRPLGYIPNLSYGKNKADKTATNDKVQDEHDCLSVVFESIRAIHRSGGFEMSIFGQEVQVKVWIHFFIGDTEGNNKWLGHYPGNKPNVQRPYRDCKCSFEEMSCTNPVCVYTTLDEMRVAKRLKRENVDRGLLLLKRMSRYDIKNSLIDKNMPLSDNIHGPYRMMPPELLHTSGSGLIKYMFESLQIQIGGGKIRDDVDKLHVQIFLSIQRQSERDFPRGSLRNGIIDGTKCQSEERKGNLFHLLCIANTTEGRNKLQRALGHSDYQWKRWVAFIKLYLSMEEWLHDNNDKTEVDHARPLVSKVLKMLQYFFERGEKTNGYCIPKMHGMTKFIPYIKRYGCAMNFYGGTGESAHKQFVKAPGQKTQRRVSEFAIQTAQQWYDILVTNRAFRDLEDDVSSPSMDSYHSESYMRINQILPDNGSVSVQLSGQYSLVITYDMFDKMKNGDDICVDWRTDDKKIKKNNKDYCLNEGLVRFLVKKIQERNKTNVDGGYKIEGYTRVSSTSEDGSRVIFYCHPLFQGRMWYDWAYVHFEEINGSGESVETYYPSKILGFVTINGTTEVIIQCSEQALIWSELEKEMFMKTILGTDMNVSYVSVPLSALVHPLCVIPDYGAHRTHYIIVLPRRNWSRYFGDRVESEYEKSL